MEFRESERSLLYNVRERAFLLFSVPQPAIQPSQASLSLCLSPRHPMYTAISVSGLYRAVQKLRQKWDPRHETELSSVINPVFLKRTANRF